MKTRQKTASIYGVIGIIIFVILSLFFRKDLGIYVIYFVLLTILFVGLLFWLWVLIDCITKEPNGSNKIAWLLAILLTNGFGALIYYFLRRPQRIKELGR